MFECSIELSKISESLKFDLVFICQPNSYIFEESMKMRETKQRKVTEEIKQGMEKRWNRK